MGGIPAGTRAEEVIDGAGIVTVSRDPGLSGRGQAMRAPFALISRVLPNSRNCSPWESRARINRGIWSLRRVERRPSVTRGSTVTWGEMFSLGMGIVSVLLNL